LTGPSAIASKAAELRDAFDRARAIPLSTAGVEQVEGLLSIRVAGDPYAIRVSEISGLANDRKVVAFPSSIPELLGVAGMRGGLVSVYSLAALLGYGREAGQARWLVLCGAEESVGLAFSDFEGYFTVPSTQVYAADKRDAARARVKHVLRAADLVCTVVSIPDLLESIKRRCDNSRPSKER
jgi:chemotaxis signal transduction protein